MEDECPPAKKIRLEGDNFCESPNENESLPVAVEKLPDGIEQLDEKEAPSGTPLDSDRPISHEASVSQPTQELPSEIKDATEGISEPPLPHKENSFKINSKSG